MLVTVRMTQSPLLCEHLKGACFAKKKKQKQKFALITCSLFKATVSDPICRGAVRLLVSGRKEMLSHLLATTARATPLV